MTGQNTPQHKTQKKQDLEQHEVQQVLEFIKRYGKLIIAGAVAATAAVLVSRGLAAKKAATLADAERMFAAAITPVQLEDVVATYPSTPTAKAALLKLAQAQYNDGNIAQARTQYERFKKEFPNSDLLPVAEFGLAHCTEADGNYAAAANEFKAFLSAHPGHFLQAAATLAEARCLEAAGNMDGARIVLEDFKANNTSSAWADPAQSALDRLEE